MIKRENDNSKQGAPISIKKGKQFEKICGNNLVYGNAEFDQLKEKVDKKVSISDKKGGNCTFEVKLFQYEDDYFEEVIEKNRKYLEEFSKKSCKDQHAHWEEGFLFDGQFFNEAYRAYKKYSDYNKEGSSEDYTSFTHQILDQYGKIDLEGNKYTKFQKLFGEYIKAELKDYIFKKLHEEKFLECAQCKKEKGIKEVQQNKSTFQSKILNGAKAVKAIEKKWTAKVQESDQLMQQQK